MSAQPEQAETAYDIVDRRCTHPNCAGKTDAYRMVGGCYNCGAKPLIGLFTATHEHGSGGKCPACGCERLHWDQLAGPDEVPAVGVITGEA